MNTYETLEDFCIGGMSIQNARSLLLSAGHSSDDVQDAINRLLTNFTVRMGKFSLNRTDAENADLFIVPA